MSGSKFKTLSRLRTGLLFLLPNILGFAAFTIVPLVMSIVLAFTNWDVQRHNMFKDEPLQFVGLENFVRLFSHPNFYQYLGNTLFLMIGIPFSIAGSLIAALLLTRKFHHDRPGFRIALLVVGAVLGGSCLILFLGFGASSVLLLLAMLALTLLLSGVLGGPTFYRTVFYAPHFTAGVATFLLWKQLYNAETGPINNALRPVLVELSGFFRQFPDWTGSVGMVLLLGVFLGLFWSQARRLLRAYEDAEAGWKTLVLSGILVGMPSLFAPRWYPGQGIGWALLAAVLVLVIVAGLRIRRLEPLHPVVGDRGLGSFLMLSAGIMILEFLCLGLGKLSLNLPLMAETGLAPPNWLSDYHWAKPAIMIMAFWAAVGSNNMILYIAGLTNIPGELYEAADIDGATPIQRFWNITWPQLAPVTFFIVIMSMIHGLQGGFEMARTMTQGGPAGATTTLSYYVFIEGFETGRLGYASAVVWALFLMVFTITMFNFKFGNRYVND